MNSLERIIGRSDTAEETGAHLGRSENCIPVHHRDELLLQGCSSRWRLTKTWGIPRSGGGIYASRLYGPCYRLPKCVVV